MNDRIAAMLKHVRSKAEEKFALKEENKLFHEDGFVVVRNVFWPSEMAVINRAIDSNPLMQEKATELLERCRSGDRPSFETIFVWNDTSGNDLFSLATRSNKLFDRLEFFFNDEIYDYHNKVVLKYPGTVGFSYHQDYGYWYGMGNLFPDMATVFIAVDPATRENGCLKLIKGSHKCGRLDHVQFNETSDSGVEIERVNQIKKILDEVYIELNVGDVVIFHANTLHGSDDNISTKPRIALLGTYNTKHNSPYLNHDHPKFQKQSKIYREIEEGDIGKMPDFYLSYRHLG